jgi:integrase
MVYLFGMESKKTAQVYSTPQTFLKKIFSKKEKPPVAVRGFKRTLKKNLLNMTKIANIPDEEKTRITKDLNVLNSLEKSRIIQQSIATKLCELTALSSELGNELESIERRIHFLRMDETPNPELITVGKSLLEIYAEFLAKREDKHSFGKIALSTIQKQRMMYANISEYLLLFIRRKYFSIGEINKPFVDDIYDHLTTTKKHGHNHAVKHLEVLRNVINYAIEREYYSGANILTVIRIKRDHRQKIEYLTIDQVKRLQLVYLENPSEDLVRDGFLFQCYTGLSYADLHDLTTANLVHETNKFWLLVDRKKNGEPSRIPVIAEAAELIKKYARFNNKWNIKISNPLGLIPMLSNGRMNQVLKLIGYSTKIPTDILKTHTGRRTFATTALNSGNISIETVAAILGHSDSKTTHKHYAKVLTGKISKEMEGFSFNSQPKQN